MTEPAPHIFLPYQQAWAGDPAAVKVVEKSRRIGLTWAESGDDALYAASTEGDNVWYIGYNKDMAEEFIFECAKWAKQYDLVAGEVEEEVLKDGDKDILTFRINFASGNKVVALSSSPSNLRGKQGRVIIDEAAFHGDLKALIKAAMALLMWGGEVRIISTHDGEENEFNTLVNEIRAGRKPYSLHRITFDEAVAQGLYKRICFVKGKEWTQEGEDAWCREIRESYGEDAAEELDVIPSRGGGTYLSRTMIEGCMSEEIKVIRYGQTDDFNYLPDYVRQAEVAAWCEDYLAPLLEGLDDKRQTVFGEDFARTGDLTVMTPAQEQQNTGWAALFVLELRNMPFQQQEQILYYIIDRLPRFKHGSFDARGNGQYLAERAMQKYGPDRISQVMLTEGWYREYMPKYKAWFEDKTWLLPRDADIIEDHRAFKMIKGVARLPESQNTGQDDKKRHGDSGISGAMVCHATQQEGEREYGYESVSRREAKDDDIERPIRTTAGFKTIRGAM